MKQLILDWLLSVLVIMVVCAVCVTICRADDSADYAARAKAAIAINLSLSTKGGTDAAPVVDTAAMAKAARPVVYIYSATWCGACQTAKEELAGSDIPFTIVVRDVSNGGQPEFVESLPWFAWDRPGGVWHAKWNGTVDLVGRWKTSRATAGPPTKQAKSSTTSIATRLKQFAATYNGPLTGLKHGNNYWWHLQEHGMTQDELQGLTQWECERIHGAIHASGMSIQQLRMRFQ